MRLLHGGKACLTEPVTRVTGSNFLTQYDGRYVCRRLTRIHPRKPLMNFEFWEAAAMVPTTQITIPSKQTFDMSL